MERRYSASRGLGFFVLVVLAPSFLAASERPNIITVFIDDMGWSDLSCFDGEQTQTENIDRLAQEMEQLKKQEDTKAKTLTGRVRRALKYLKNEVLMREELTLFVFKPKAS